MEWSQAWPKNEEIFEIFSKILNVNMSASESSIEKIFKWFEEMGYPIILKQLDNF